MRNHFKLILGCLVGIFVLMVAVVNGSMDPPKRKHSLLFKSEIQRAAMIKAKEAERAKYAKENGLHLDSESGGQGVAHTDTSQDSGGHH